MREAGGTLGAVRRAVDRRRAAGRATGHRLTVGLLAVALAGCSTPGAGAGSPSVAPAAPSAPATATRPGTGITAEPVSTALPVQARDLRLVRVGANEIALQFEFANGGDRPITPDALGIDQFERVLMLVDLPRSTSYETLTAQGNDGRISDSNGTQVPPGGAVTVTAVFTAPPAETSELTAFIDGFLPVAVPVQPAGSPTLLDDPVLTAIGPGSDPNVKPIVCAASGPGRAGESKRTVIRLPSDVLFAFGSADLSPAAQQAVAAVDDEIGSGGTGTVTIEGHTDAIGSDADNQGLSERRAAAVRPALEAELGSGFEYRSVGFGESRPVAPNTRPDGTDDPDGRTLNRRVEIRTGSAEPGSLPTLEALPATRDLADAGLRAEVAGLERYRGYLMVRLAVSNPTGQAIELAPGSGLTPQQADPIGLTVADRTDQLRQRPCHTSGRSLGFYYLANPTGNYTLDDSSSVPAGATVTFYGFYAPPAAGVTSVDVEIGGFGETVPTPIP
ncbi:MAG: OmpA-OmpF porin, family [Pseudonocardiales bacterium]|nr:OmpA-OmpF porin, family [Pseudonocardiales bacterium]